MGGVLDQSLCNPKAINNLVLMMEDEVDYQAANESILIEFGRTVSGVDN